MAEEGSGGAIGADRQMPANVLREWGAPRSARPEPDDAGAPHDEVPAHVIPRADEADFTSKAARILDNNEPRASVLTLKQLRENSDVAGGKLDEVLSHRLDNQLLAHAFGDSSILGIGHPQDDATQIAGMTVEDLEARLQGGLDRGNANLVRQVLERWNTEHRPGMLRSRAHDATYNRLSAAVVEAPRIHEYAAAEIAKMRASFETERAAAYKPAEEALKALAGNEAVQNFVQALLDSPWQERIQDASDIGVPENYSDGLTLAAQFKTLNNTEQTVALNYLRHHNVDHLYTLRNALVIADRELYGSIEDDNKQDSAELLAKVNAHLGGGDDDAASVGAATASSTTASSRSGGASGGGRSPVGDDVRAALTNATISAIHRILDEVQVYGGEAEGYTGMLRTVHSLIEDHSEAAIVKLIKRKYREEGEIPENVTAMLAAAKALPPLRR